MIRCDSKDSYPVNAEIYAGKGLTAAQYHCEKLTAIFHARDRNLATDDWFTSVKTVQQLLEKKITVIGTLRKNKREIPPTFLKVKHRQKNSPIFAYTDVSLFFLTVRRKR